MFDVIEESLKDQGVEDYDQGTPKVNTTTPVVEQLIEDIEKDGKVKVTEYTYDAETGEFFYIVEIVVESIGSGLGSGSGSAQSAPPGFLDSFANIVENALKDQGIEDFYQGTPQVDEDPIVKKLIEEIESSGNMIVTSYDYNSETGNIAIIFTTFDVFQLPID